MCKLRLMMKLLWIYIKLDTNYPVLHVWTTSKSAYCKIQILIAKKLTNVIFFVKMSVCFKCSIRWRKKLALPETLMNSTEFLCLDIETSSKTTQSYRYRGRILRRNLDKSLKSIPPCSSLSPIQLCLEISISSNSLDLLQFLQIIYCTL
jgi:hypothetical protein